jgi:hypothetical protein
LLRQRAQPEQQPQRVDQHRLPGVLGEHAHAHAERSERVRGEIADGVRPGPSGHEQRVGDQDGGGGQPADVVGRGVEQGGEDVVHGHMIG